MKLLVRNIARTVKEEELKAAFEKFGTVQSCSIVIDKETGISKGFGFVEIPNPGHCKAAMKSLNGKELAGSLLRVKKAESAEDREAKENKAIEKKEAKAKAKEEAKKAEEQRKEERQEERLEAEESAAIKSFTSKTKSYGKNKGVNDHIWKK
ncbi:RNA recognition motif domain-containing protein [Marinicella rhabdoformis]|uniref:RNA recognition motif domain-containing protein n=1 Tax=Marinicella rhabdoformis TaxID=2580566 RepID=UPI0015D01798|nr:RNA-binding protein [Marinicella rhabdoformis]